MAAAALLLAAAWWWRSQQQPADLAAPDPGPFDPYAPDAEWQPDEENTAPDWSDELTAALSTARNFIAPTPAAGMSISPAGLAHLQKSESLSLTRYRLGDGGWTIGWGRYYRDGGPVPPERIDRATADAWFAEDIESRAARWVRAYVTAPLTQPQFDALASMAYNLSPKSFRTIADAVNEGRDPEAAALRFVRAGTNLERGLRNRRKAEMALYRTDPSTYA
jgi:lysozyme